jgi:hypothetical protein
MNEIEPVATLGNQLPLLQSCDGCVSTLNHRQGYKVRRIHLPQMVTHVPALTGWHVHCQGTASSSFTTALQGTSIYLLPC